MTDSRRYRLADPAIADLIELYTYLHERSPIAAERFTESIERKIADLASSRHPGVARDHLRPGLRAFPYRRRCIYFRIIEDCMVVLRIVHGRQDITANDFPESDT